jgi:hypothetical protein
MSWEVAKYKIELELNEPMLGTTPCNPSIWAEHIATKQTKALKKEGWTDDKIKAEIEKTVEGVADNDELESGKTTFMSDKKGYYVRDYFVKGFFKEAARAKKEFGAMKQLRDKVGKYLFVRPRNIYVAKAGAELELIERPLRAQTPQGERVAIARSEAVPAGTKLAFEVHCLQGVISKKCLEELLAYGEYQGFGQWRNSGHGSFSVLSMVEA